MEDQLQEIINLIRWQTVAIYICAVVLLFEIRRKK